MSEKGTRLNKNKLRWRNFPMFLVRPMIEVAHWGETKYETFNFLKGQTINDCLDSAKRHMDKFEDPSLPDNDEETGITHLAHAAWNLLVAAYMIKTRPDLDDRYKTKPALFTSSPRWKVNQDGTCDLITENEVDSSQVVVQTDSGNTVSSGNLNWDLSRVQDGYVDDFLKEQEKNLRICKTCEKED